MGKFQVGDILRYSKGFDPAAPVIDGFPNFVHVTHSQGMPKALLEAGINPIARVRDSGGQERRPAILISNSPHREGAELTPWRDLFDVDNGHIRCFGDAKTPAQIRPRLEATGLCSRLMFCRPRFLRMTVSWLRPLFTSDVRR